MFSLSADFVDQLDCPRFVKMDTDNEKLDAVFFYQADGGIESTDHNQVVACKGAYDDLRSPRLMGDHDSNVLHGTIVVA